MYMEENNRKVSESIIVSLKKQNEERKAITKKLFPVTVKIKEMTQYEI